MSDARGLLDRISAFRKRLEAAPRTAEAVEADPAAAQSMIARPEAFRQTLRQMTGTSEATDGPLPPQLTARAHQLLATAKSLLARQRTFAADPLVVGLSAGADADTDSLATYHRETVAVMESAVRLAQVFPPSPTSQLRLCDGLDGILGIVRDRLAVQEQALARRRAEFDRIDRLAALLSRMSQYLPVSLSPIAALAEELLEEARQTRPVRFLSAAPFSTHSYPGGPETLAPARYVAAHALNVAQVVARIVPLDYEWAGRPLPAVVAALVMDCGLLGIPTEVLAKPGPLGPDERRIVEQHARAGAEIVAKYLPDAPQLTTAVAAHHERPDGTGYPVGVKREAIPSLARLLGTADVYAALCAPRPYREARDTRTALTDVLLMAEEGRLDRDFAEYLVCLSFYPVGTVVELTDGRIGVVAASHPNRLDPAAPGRPVVAVLAEADGTLLPRPEYLDLSVSTRGGIFRTLTQQRRAEVLGQRYPDLV